MTDYDLPPPPEDKTYAVKLRCGGDKGDVWESILIPVTHECFDLPPAPVSSLIEFPIVVHKTYSLPLVSTPRHLLDNQKATFLMIDPDSGFAPPEWQSRVGTVIVARKDKKPLDLRHFEGVWMYNDMLLDLFGDGMDGPALRKEGMMTKKHFAAWFKRYAVRQREVRGSFMEVNPHLGGGTTNEWDKVPPLF